MYQNINCLYLIIGNEMLSRILLRVTTLILIKLSKLRIII